MYIRVSELAKREIERNNRVGDSRSEFLLAHDKIKKTPRQSRVRHDIGKQNA